MKTFFVRTTFFAVEVHGKEDEFKRLHRCRLGQLLKSRKMKAPPNKLAYREDGTVLVKLENVASRLVNSKRMKKQLTEKLSNKEHNGKHFIGTYMYFHLVLVFS